MDKFLDEYSRFVDNITSEESKDLAKLIVRLIELNDQGINVARLLTGTIGAASEGGEFAEIVKKTIFQGKPLTDDSLFHMKRELGDEMWYWMQKCMSLHIDPKEVIEENIRKLEARYPGGWSVARSEVREEGDI